MSRFLCSGLGSPRTGNTWVIVARTIGVVTMHNANQIGSILGTTSMEGETAPITNLKITGTIIGLSQIELAGTVVTWVTLEGNVDPTIVGVEEITPLEGPDNPNREGTTIGVMGGTISRDLHLEHWGLIITLTTMLRERVAIQAGISNGG